MRPAPNRPSRQSAKGQAMAIFALVSVLLFVIAGLSVDAGTSYLTSNKLERAAAAAALAGVAYLPGDYPDAQNAALVEAARDGYPNAGSGNACAGNPSPCVVTSQPTTNELKVTISTSVSTIFLRLLGFGSHTVVRSETAQYLPPISLGQPGAQQGSGMNGSCIGLPNYCSNPPSGLGSNGNYYFEREEGWGNPRSEGDPFTPSPAQSGNGCGSGDPCSAASAPDFHQVSPEAGTEPQYATLNYQGGSNYLIEIPVGQSADVQVYNPAFAADTCGTGGGPSGYCYHEGDGSFPAQPAPYTAYSAMVYSLFKVTTISSRSSDLLQSQEVFYPYNATNAGSGSISYFPHCLACVPSATTVGYVPTTYHQWVSAVNYAPTNATDIALFGDPTDFGNNYLTDPSATVPQYYRLEVDTMQWNGQPTCTSSGCAIPTTGTSAQSEAHKGYAVRLVSDAGSPPSYLGTLGAVSGSTNNTLSACPTTTPTCGTISSMDDMTVFTPVNGANATQFSIPLFSLDPVAYAGQTINVDLFDPGDVNGGNAYMGLQAPDGTWATVNSISDIGASLGGASPPSGGSNVPVAWPSGGCSSACFQTANGGGVIYDGQWLQLQMTVTSSATGYYNLVYNVGATATAADTFAVEVGFSGSPDHLLP
jgi:hypothetical protein